MIWNARCGKALRNRGSCYTSRFAMRAKSRQEPKRKREAAGPRLVAHAALPTRYGRFTIYGFEGRGPQEEAVALVRGSLNGKSAPLVRVHSQCLTGDVLTSLRCDCRAQLELSLKKIGQAACGQSFIRRRKRSAYLGELTCCKPAIKNAPLIVFAKSFAWPRPQ